MSIRDPVPRLLLGEPSNGWHSSRNRWLASCASYVERQGLRLGSDGDHDVGRDSGSVLALVRSLHPMKGLIRGAEDPNPEIFEQPIRAVGNGAPSPQLE